MQSFDFENATFNHGETVATFHYLTLGDDDVPEHVTSWVHDVMKRRTPKSEIVKQVGPFERNKFYHLKFKQRNIKNRTEFLKERYGDDPESLEKINNNVSDAKFLPFALDCVYYLWSREEWKASVWQDLVVRYTVYALLHFTSVELNYEVEPKDYSVVDHCRHACTFEPFRDGKKNIMAFDPERIFPEHTFGYEKTSTMTDVLMGKEEDSSLMVVIKATLPVKRLTLGHDFDWVNVPRKDLAKEMFRDSWWETLKRLKMHLDSNKFNTRKPRLSEEFRKNSKDKTTFNIFPTALTADTMALTAFGYKNHRLGVHPPRRVKTLKNSYQEWGMRPGEIRVRPNPANLNARRVYTSAPMYFLLNRAHVGQLCDMLTKRLLDPVLRTLPTPRELFEELFHRMNSKEHVGFVLAKEITFPLFLEEFPMFKKEREEYLEHRGEIWSAEDQDLHNLYCTVGEKLQDVDDDRKYRRTRYTKQPGFFIMGPLKKRRQHRSVNERKRLIQERRELMKRRKRLEKKKEEARAKVVAFAATQGLSVEDLEVAFN